MGSPRAPRPQLSLLVDVVRSPDGRLDGHIRTTVATGTGHPFSGVLELLKVLEDLLDRDEASAANTPPTEGEAP
jgi:hypothetical protein